MPAYARPDVPKHAPKTGKQIQIQVEVEVQPKPPLTEAVRQPSGTMQLARDADGPLRIGSEVEGDADVGKPSQVRLSERTIACDAR